MGWDLELERVDKTQVTQGAPGGRGRSQGQGRGPGHRWRGPLPLPPRLHPALRGLLQAGLPATLRPQHAQLQCGKDRHGMATRAGAEP